MTAAGKLSATKLWTLMAEQSIGVYPNPHGNMQLMNLTMESPWVAIRAGMLVNEQPFAAGGITPRAAVKALLEAK